MRLAATHALIGNRDLIRLHLDKAEGLASGQDFLELARTGYAYEHDSDRLALVNGIALALRMRDGG